MRRQTLLAALGLWVVAGAMGLAQTQAAPAPSLYKRLGGYDAIAAVTDDFVSRLVNDKVVGRYLVGLSDSSKARLRQHFVDQLCAATGGPCIYVGRDMKTVHKGLGITGAEWDISGQASDRDSRQVQGSGKGEGRASRGGLRPEAGHRREAVAFDQREVRSAFRRRACRLPRRIAA